MSFGKKILKNAKEAYESLLALYCDLCKAEDLIEAQCIFDKILLTIEEVRANYFFPVSLSCVFEINHPNTDVFTEETRISVVKELYEWLVSLLFQFEEANIVSMRPYMKVLEYGRTFIPYSMSCQWGEDYRRDLKFSHASFYFAVNAGLYQTNENKYQEYSQSLRNEIHSVRGIFPKEKVVPKKMRERVQTELSYYQREYQEYIENHYASLKHEFSNYNKRIQLYLHQRSKNVWVAMMNLYEAPSPECIVYPKIVDVMFRFHNVEAQASRVCGWGLTEISEESNFKFMFGEQSIHRELNKIFIKYASESDLIAYAMFMLRGQLRKINYIKLQNELMIDNEKYIICLLESLTRSNIQEIINKYKGTYKGLILRHEPSRDIVLMLQEAKLSYMSVVKMGDNIITNWNGEMIHLYIKDKINRLKIAQSDNATLSSELLCQRLEKCPIGRDGWTEYEDIGAEIFKYLFADEFRHFKYEVQSTTEDGIARRDMIVHNTYKTSPCFWEQMKDEFKAKVIIIDFKNYSGPLDTDEFYKVSKYFNNKLGYFAILFTRNGLDASAMKKQSKMLSEEKLILCLSDTDLKNLMDRKERNQNPTDILEDIYYSLCKKD